MEAPFSGDSISDIERTFAAGEMPNVAREFVHPGKQGNYEDILMRTVFRDENQRNAAIIFLRKCEEFGLEDHIDMMVNWLAASVSVGGRARLELLQAITGVIATDLNPSARHSRYPDKRKEEGER